MGLKGDEAHSSVFVIGGVAVQQERPPIPMGGVPVASPGRALRLRSDGQHQGRSHNVGLVQWLTKSDESAFAQFYDATSGLLFGLLLHALRDTSTAEEVLSRVYADIKQEAARFDKRNTCLLIWVITLAHWHAYEHLRSSETGERFTGLIGPRQQSPTASHTFHIDKSEHKRLVSAALASLSPEQLQMIELVYFSRMSPVEIALRLGQRLETVKRSLQTGMLKLCRLFKNDGPAHSTQKRSVHELTKNPTK